MLERFLILKFPQTDTITVLFRVTSFKARVMCYSTEDPAKVRKALRNVVGEDIQITSRKTQGYYRDPIYVMECYSNNEKIVSGVFNRILAALGMERWYLLKPGVEMTSREHGRIHIRLDKQEAYLGRIRLSDRDAVKIEFSFKGSVEELEEAIRGET